MNTVHISWKYRSASKSLSGVLSHYLRLIRVFEIAICFSNLISEIVESGATKSLAVMEKPLSEGLAGLMGAICGLNHLQGAPITSLRNINPYVSASLQEWQAQGQLKAVIPRQPAAIVLVQSSAAAGSL